MRSRCRPPLPNLYFRTAGWKDPAAFPLQPAFSCFRFPSLIAQWETRSCGSGAPSASFISGHGGEAGHPAGSCGEEEEQLGWEKLRASFKKESLKKNLRPFCLSVCPLPPKHKQAKKTSRRKASASLQEGPRDHACVYAACCMCSQEGERPKGVL